MALSRSVLSWFACLLGVVAACGGAFAENVSVQVTARSIQLTPATFTSPLPGVGTVTAYFTTYSPTRTPLYDVVGGYFYISQELRPRSGQPGVYETDYIIVQGNTASEYGSLVLNLSTADTNGNGLPDILEIGRPVNIGITGSARSDTLTGVTYSVSGTWTRAAGSIGGSATITLTQTAGGSGITRLNSAINLVATDPIRSSASYVRSPSNVLTFNLTFPNADGTASTTSFTAPFTVTDVDHLAVPAFAFVDSNGRRFQVQAATLTRTGNTYRGNLRLVDGEPQTSWSDYLDWFLEITDPNDSNSNGVPNLSDTVQVAPTITVQPTSRNVSAGTSTSLSVTATGTGPLSYQWLLNGNPIAGATSATLSLTNVAPTAAGTYTVVVTNSLGSVTSDVAVVAVTTVPPTFTSAPTGADVLVGGSATFAAQASGQGITYQWLLNGNPIIGATDATYTVGNAQPWTSGAYSVRVANSGGSITSAAAPLTLNAAQYLSDDFSGTAVNPATWSAAQPFSDSQTLVGSGMLTLKNRGRLLSTAALPTAYRLKTRFRLSGSSYDVFAVFLRTSGATANGSFNSGVWAEFAYRSGDQGTVGASNVKLYDAAGSQPVTGSFSLALATWYDAIIDDDGNKVTVSINGTVVVSRSTSARTGNLVGLQNREGAGGGSSISANSITDVDYVTVVSPSSVPVSPTASEPRLANLSTRGYVGSGSDAMICGFYTQGSKPQRLIIRAAGPTLASFGVGGTINDPQLIMRDQQKTVVAANDNWTADSASAMASVSAFPFIAGSRDAAIVGTFTPGQYTIEVSGVGGGTGAAIVEAYDRDTSDDAVRIVNISTRGPVGAGQDLIAGMVVTGTSPRKVLVRAIGPTLSDFGVPNALPDPVLTIYGPGSTKLYQNDDWGTQDNAIEISPAAAGSGRFGVPYNSKDAAALVYLPPGQYSFVISSKGNAAGVAIIEAYEIK